MVRKRWKIVQKFMSKKTGLRKIRVFRLYVGSPVGRLPNAALGYSLRSLFPKLLLYELTRTELLLGKKCEQEHYQFLSLSYCCANIWLLTR